MYGSVILRLDKGEADMLGWLEMCEREGEGERDRGTWGEMLPFEKRSHDRDLNGQVLGATMSLSPCAQAGS